MEQGKSQEEQSEQKGKSGWSYLFIILLGSGLLLLSEYFIVQMGWIHMFSIVPILFLNSTLIGFVLKKQKWNWYSYGMDNGVMIGIGIVLLYGLISIPYNFQREGKDAIIYILNSLAVVIAGLFFYPVVLRMFTKRNRKKGS